ncbi:MAG: DUF1349 domain-containing protein [Candidatus Bathyarchaeota archaeon]|nr:DUF1349 domain-containing protein [Candidatus Bathyarchaeota archaeon]
MRKRLGVVFTVATLSILILAYGATFAAANVGYVDEFTDSSLGSFWTFVDPLGTSSYSLTAHSGWLRITAPVGAALAPTSNYNAPRVLQSVTGSFVATTYVNGNFSEDGFRAGLLLWNNTNNYMRVEKWGANKVLMYGVIGGTVRSQQANLPSSSDSLYLKLEKSGTTISGSWSQNGATWNLIAQYTNFNAADPVQVGLFALTVGSTNFSPDFDYFHINPGNIFVVPEYPLLGTMAIPIAMGAAFIIHRRRPKQKTNATA